MNKHKSYLSCVDLLSEVKSILCNTFSAILILVIRAVFLYFRLCVSLAQNRKSLLYVYRKIGIFIKFEQRRNLSPYPSAKSN